MRFHGSLLFFHELSACPAALPHTYLSTNLCYGLLCCVALAAACIVHVHYSSVRVLKTKIKSASIHNRLWRVYYTVCFFEALLNLVRAATLSQRLGWLSDSLGVACCVLSGAAPAALAVALAYHLRHCITPHYASTGAGGSRRRRCSAVAAAAAAGGGGSRTDERADGDDTDELLDDDTDDDVLLDELQQQQLQHQQHPLRASLAVLGLYALRSMLRLELAAIVLLAFFLICTVLQFTVPLVALDVFAVLWLVSYALLRLAVLALALLVTWWRGRREGPSSLAIVLLWLSLLFFSPALVPMHVWADMLHSVKPCVFYIASLTDLVVLSSSFSLFFSVLFVRAEFLRNVEEAKWAQISKIREGEDVHRVGDADWGARAASSATTGGGGGSVGGLHQQVQQHAAAARFFARQRAGGGGGGSAAAAAHAHLQLGTAQEGLGADADDLYSAAALLEPDSAALPWRVTPVEHAPLPPALAAYQTTINGGLY